MISEFIKIVDELTDVFLDLTAIANMKLSAVTTNRVATVEECMTKEQSLSLKVRGLEKRRMDEQIKLGYENKTFPQILSVVSEEDKALLKPVFDRFTQTLSTYIKIHEDVSMSINVSLRKLQKEVVARHGIAFDKGLHKDQIETHLTNRSV